MEKEQISKRIFSEIEKVSGKSSPAVGKDTRLIGPDAIFDSVRLVETCLCLEVLADELGFEFDWSSEHALSRSRGMFRTAGSLCEAFLEQLKLHKKG